MDSKVLYQQARDLHLEKDYEGAERIYKKIISEHPSSDEAKASMGHIHYIHKEAIAKNKTTHAAAPISVVVTDIQIPFWSMVHILVYLSLASIPAIIILFITYFVITLGVGGAIFSIFR